VRKHGVAIAGRRNEKLERKDYCQRKRKGTKTESQIMGGRVALQADFPGNESGFPTLSV
jgi:hypothetical protein